MNEILTPCVLQTIIISISSLLALYCIASLIKSLAGKKNNCETCHEKKQLSYRLIVGFLIFLLVILLSHKFYADDNVFNFMSFASAIISIILAVLTIIYTYYTQGTTTSSAEKIEKASVKMQEVASSVEKTSKLYMNSAESLNNNIGLILDKIGHVEEQTNQLLIKQIMNNSDGSPIQGDEISHFVEVSSQLGTIALYAMKKAYKYKKPFPLNKLGGNENEGYVAGYIIASSSFNLLEADFDSQNEVLHISVSEYKQELGNLIESKIVNKIKSGDNNEKEFYTEYKKIVDDFYNEESVTK